MTPIPPWRALVLELALAVGMIACLIGAMFLHTGSMPPLVVVESASMIHSPSGEVGSIDAGDLIFVHQQPPSTIVTFAEATNPNNPAYGYEQHGLAGDVIIYDKNGEGGTPIIHRAILKVIASQTDVPDRIAANPCAAGGTYDRELRAEDGKLGACILTWSVPGTSVANVSSISLAFDGEAAGYYDCHRPAHAGIEAFLVIQDWTPKHEGFLTLGDNNKCSVDQGSEAVAGSAGVHSASGVVGPVRDGWILGVAGGELPWLGTVKLMLGGPDSYGTGDVPSSSFTAIFVLIMLVFIAPYATEILFKAILRNAPELQLTFMTKQNQEES